MISKAAIARVVGMLEPNIDDLTFKHQSGTYRGKKRNEKYYFYQDASVDPPIFPSIRYNYDVWDRIKEVNKDQLDMCIACIM